MACFIFDGIDYGGLLDVVSVEEGALPATSPDLRTAPGRDGAYLAGNLFEPLEVKVTARLATGTIDARDIQREWSVIAARLRTREPRPLSLSEGIYRMAVLANESALEFATYSAKAELTFICPDPIAYGIRREITVPSGGSATFNVGGTYPTRPRITASATRNSSSLVWGLRLDEGDYIHVSTGSASARTVDIDCANRTCIVNTAAALPTLDSDWLELAPGEHTLRMDQGTGAATVAFDERWM